MKDKMKKIIAGVGIGVMLGSGAALTGCSVMGISDEDTAKMWDIIEEVREDIGSVEDKVNKMESTLSDVDESLEYISLKQRGFDLYRMACSKLVLLDESIFNNFRMSSSSILKEDYLYEISHLKMSDGKRVLYMTLEEGNEVKEKECLYEIENEKILCSSNNFTTKKMDEESYSYEVSYFFSGMFDDLTEQFTFENMVECKLLEDGNYEIVFASSIGVAYGVSVVVTSDARLVTMDVLFRDGDFYGGVMTFEYGVVDEEVMQGVIDELKALPDEPQDDEQGE